MLTLVCLLSVLYLARSDSDLYKLSCDVHYSGCRIADNLYKCNFILYKDDESCTVSVYEQSPPNRPLYENCTEFSCTGEQTSCTCIRRSNPLQLWSSSACASRESYDKDKITPMCDNNIPNGTVKVRFGNSVKKASNRFIIDNNYQNYVFRESWVNLIIPLSSQEKKYAQYTIDEQKDRYECTYIYNNQDQTRQRWCPSLCDIEVVLDPSTGLVNLTPINFKCATNMKGHIQKDSWSNICLDKNSYHESEKYTLANKHVCRIPLNHECVNYANNENPDVICV